MTLAAVIRRENCGVRGKPLVTPRRSISHSATSAKRQKKVSAWAQRSFPAPAVGQAATAGVSKQGADTGPQKAFVWMLPTTAKTSAA